MRKLPGVTIVAPPAPQVKSKLANTKLYKKTGIVSLEYAVT
jgi:hypothetical protein